MKYEQKIIQTEQAIFDSKEELEVLNQVFKYVMHRLSYHKEDSGWVKSLSGESKQIINSIYQQLK